MTIPRIQSYQFENVKNAFDNKVSWSLDVDKSVLLIHDMQNYFVDFYQRNLDPVKTLTHNISELKKHCKSVGMDVIYTRQPGDQSSEDRALLTDFWGYGLKDVPEQTGIISDIAPEAEDIVYTKWRYSAFKRTPLLDFMQTHKKDQLIICGIYAHIGVLSTCLDAFMYDIKPFVVADAVADFSLQEQKYALDYIAKRCGHVETMDTIFSQLSDAKLSCYA